MSYSCSTSISLTLDIGSLDHWIMMALLDFVIVWFSNILHSVTSLPCAHFTMTGNGPCAAEFPVILKLAHDINIHIKNKIPVTTIFLVSYKYPAKINAWSDLKATKTCAKTFFSKKYYESSSRLLANSDFNWDSNLKAILASWIFIQNDLM